MMNLEDVKAWIARIEALRFEDERARLLEDEMLDALLDSIAAGTCDDPAACAAEARRSRMIDFNRYGATDD